MVRETHAYGLPCLDENPFSIRPLEAGESGKLIGREDVFTRLQSFLKLRSARRIMLLGPLGSGRTSLVRCLKPYAGASATIDHLPAKSPATSLLTMCYRQMIGGEPPLDRMELVNDLVNEMYSFNEKLPLIVIDVPASDLSVLEVALRDAHSSLERLNALLVLVCDVKERHQLPSAVLDGFELHRLSPFTAGDVMALVRQRLASVGAMDCEFSMQDAAALLDDCDGYPASVITLLRDAVDSIRMGQSQTPPRPFVDTSARIQPRDEPESLHKLMGENIGQVEKDPEQEPAVPERREDLAATEDSISEVIDASLPWNQRPQLQDSSTPSFDQGIDPLPFGFDLDMDKLLEEQDKDEPLQAPPFTTPIIDADAAMGGPSTPVKGMFKNLAQRNKDANLTKGIIPEVEQFTQDELVDASNQHQYWVNEALMPPPPEEPISEDESTMLLHDEVGFVESPFLPETSEHPVADQPLMDQSPSYQHSNNAMLEAFNGLMAMLQPTPNPTPHHEGLLSFFQQRFREKEGPRETYALDKHVLSSLNPSESYVVSVAHQRDYSPSDEHVLEHLSIKRARLSQISNRLLKCGILQARQVGRSRKYSLTQAARAQLIAWGAVGGDV